VLHAADEGYKTSTGPADAPTCPPSHPHLPVRKTDYPSMSTTDQKIDGSDERIELYDTTDPSTTGPLSRNAK
jgi:hypothetical protein